MVSGDYARRNAGADLGVVDSRMLFRIGYSALLDMGIRTKEEHDAVAAVDRKLNDAQYELDTGLPAITRSMPSADQL